MWILWRNKYQRRQDYIVDFLDTAVSRIRVFRGWLPKSRTRNRPAGIMAKEAAKLAGLQHPEEVEALKTLGVHIVTTLKAGRFLTPRKSQHQRRVGFVARGVTELVDLSPRAGASGRDARVLERIG